jgi:hypothetical protein
LKTTSINSNSKFTKEKEMADFRKWFLVLAVLAVLAVPVSAQQPTVVCTTSSAPDVVRNGGLTELVGDVIMSCDNTAAGAVSIQTDIYVSMNYAQITNKVLNNNGSHGECPTGIQCVTDSVAVAHPAANNSAAVTTYVTGLLQSNLGGSDLPSTRNQVLFPLVPVPAGTVTVIRISNIRVAVENSDASVSTGLVQIFALVSTNNVVLQPQAELPVAKVLVPMQFKAFACDGASAANTTFQQCNGVNQGTGSMLTTFNVEFIEGFALAFKPMTSTGPVIVGNQFLSESGYLLGTLTSPGTSQVPNVGLASTGTNLILGFTNIPAGINIFVTDQEVATGTSPGALTGVNGALVAITAIDSLSTSGGNMRCTLVDSPDSSNMPAHQVPIVGGAGSVSWVVTAVDPALNYQKSISFGVAVSYTPNTTLGLPGLTVPPGGGVTGALGPISSTDWAVPIATAPIPRFLSNPKTASIFSVNPCFTNLLFPYLTVKAGFDTGIALVNTSLDAPVWGANNTATQHGACIMYYFDASATPPPPQTSCDIAPGGMVAFSLMGSGGVPSVTCSNGTTVTNTPIPIGWQGYGIAHCNFQWAHGYAFVSDRNIPGLGSQGYLALVFSSGGRAQVGYFLPASEMLSQ